jgi:hypothetical protein
MATCPTPVLCRVAQSRGTEGFPPGARLNRDNWIEDWGRTSGLWSWGSAATSEDVCYVLWGRGVACSALSRREVLCCVVRKGGDGVGGCMVLRSGGEVRQRGWAHDLAELGLATPATRTRHHLIPPAPPDGSDIGSQTVARLTVELVNRNSVVTVVHREVTAYRQSDTS